MSSLQQHGPTVWIVVQSKTSLSYAVSIQEVIWWTIWMFLMQEVLQWNPYFRSFGGASSNLPMPQAACSWMRLSPMHLDSWLSHRFSVQTFTWQLQSSLSRNSRLNRCEPFACPQIYSAFKSRRHLCNSSSYFTILTRLRHPAFFCSCGTQ
jgi:hypothetical protein